MKRTPIVAPSASREFIAGDGAVGQDKTKFIPTTGDARVEGGEIEPVPADALKNFDKLDRLRFMEDELEIMVMPNNDPLADPMPKVACNGTNQFYVRGQKMRMKRKFVAALAQAKSTKYRSDVKLDAGTGEYINAMIPTTGLLDNFSVLHDPAGARGRAWLETVLAEG